MPGTAPFRNQPILTSDQLRARLPGFYKSLREFNDGYFFESHETLEDLWMVTPWPARQFFQGIIQLAAAFVHLARAEYPGTIKLLDAASDKLTGFAPAIFGVDVEALVADVRRAREELVELGEERVRLWRSSNVPVIRYAPANGFE